MAATGRPAETVLATDRLTVRHWTQDDHDRAFAIYSRWEVARWLGSTPRALAEPAEARAMVERWRLRSTDPRFGVWAVERQDSGTVVGSVLLVPLPGGDGEVEIGWHLHPDSWGHGFATEAARGVLAKGFADGLAEIRAVVRPGNGPSAAVCRRLGMTLLGPTSRWYGVETEEYRIARTG
ncbi:GNAT family N-acetyltransferase [Kitasatospora sp. NPDC047058]|uniref:GNAT family N-acetyltransferase n=1 Tax=Kitasatospora sp. NPDC047058 TaxID=3155620 RepID=UPI0033C4EB82